MYPYHPYNRGFARPPPPPSWDPEPWRLPQRRWAFRVSLAGPSAVLPLAPYGTRPSATAVHEDVATTWVMVQYIGGTINWWRLRWDYTVSAVMEVPPYYARPTWYAWETEDAEYMFQNVATGAVTWMLPRDSLPAPSKPGAEWIKPGSGVRIFHHPGVTPCRELEKYHGVQGTVHSSTGGDGSNRLAYIILPPELGDEVPQVPADWLQPLAAETVVTLSGLGVGPLQRLNGTQARVDDGLLREADTMNVALTGGAIVRVGIEHLTPVPKIRNLDLQGPTNEEQLCSFTDDVGGSHQFSLKLPGSFKERFSLAHRRGEQAEPWPVLVFLHGHRGKSMFHPSRQRGHTEGLRFAAETFIVVSPHCGWHWQTRPHAWVEQLVRHLSAASWVDRNRLYISGCSMGGMGSWELAASVKDLVAAVAPVAAHHHAERTECIAQSLRHVPVLALASQSDACCRIQPEMNLWRQIMLHGNEKFVAGIVPNLWHGAMFDAAYCQDATLYRWLLAHRLSA